MSIARPTSLSSWAGGDVSVDLFRGEVCVRTIVVSACGKEREVAMFLERSVGI